MAARKRSKTRKRSTRKKARARKATRRKVARKKGRGKKKKAAKRKPAKKKRSATKKKTARKAAGRPAAKPAPRPATAPAAKPAAAPARPPATQMPLGTASVAAGAPVPIGKVTHYYGHVNAAIVSLESGELRVGDMVHFRGHTTDFYQRVDHMEVDHQAVQSARAGQVIGLQVSQRVREGDAVTKVAR
jgi:putative protease